nr:putative retrotransposon protein [Tanacetum cinerariifolium]
DGHHAAVEAIGENHLCLSSGLVLILHNYHYAPSIIRGIILVSRLYKNGFVNHFENDNSISIFKNNMIYFNYIPHDDIYEIVMSSSNANDSYVYALSNKRAKLNLDSALLWHCRLEHINKKRIKKFQHDGLLDSTDLKSFENYVACTSDTSLDHKEDDQEINEPQSDINYIRRSTRKRHAPDRMCLYIDAEEHELGDLGEPANYKAALLDPESDKWLNAMNVEICFAIKDLGESAYTLGIKIYQDRSRRLIGLCQSAYIEKILKRFYMENSKRRTIPMQEKLKFSKSRGASTPAEIRRMQNIPYASVVGSIMYVVRCTRPDVAFAQIITSRFQHESRGDTKRELGVSCYTDVGYLTVADDMKSQTGYVFILNRGIVDWKSTKQSIFATSSTDAEYIAAFDASKEVVWI